DSGEILIDGVDISRLKGDALRKERQKIGMIFQHFNLLWSKTVLENIMFPLELAKVPKEEWKQRATDMAEKVGLGDKLNVYPSTLSGGQKQRVAIARALVLNPKILLCDEATSALDPKTTEDILELLKQINKEYGLTIMMISHQMETVQKICHKLAVMADGKVVEEGTVNDIFSNPTHPLTKELIQTVDTGVDVVKMSKQLKEKYPQGHLLRITFEDNTSEKPLLYSIALKLNIPINIVSANIKSTQAGSLGVMYIHIEAKEDVEPFLIELEKQGLKVEVV
ncbi:MAG: methionine ABC transporter ATP-binding protein, partial [Erysipelotrichaceae bacterium]|nr:methionine ABC transporter ATP-binding protein [Erysipelotrichaceae bacterium]